MSKAFKCTCGGEIVDFQKEDDNTIWITIFTCGNYGKWKWNVRLRLIWDLLRGKRIYGDQINITKENGYSLAEYLISTEKEKEKEDVLYDATNYHDTDFPCGY